MTHHVRRYTRFSVFCHAEYSHLCENAIPLVCLVCKNEFTNRQRRMYRQTTRLHIYVFCHSTRPQIGKTLLAQKTTYTRFPQIKNAKPNKLTQITHTISRFKDKLC